MKKIILVTIFLLLLCGVGYAKTDRAIIQDYDSNDGVNVTGNRLDVNATIIDTASNTNISVDTTTSGITVEGYIQHQVMDGNVLRVGVQDLELADDASITLLLTTSATAQTFFLAEATAGGDAELFLYENPTVTTLGTATTGQRVNRQIASTFGATMSYGATCSNYGTKICDKILAGGEKGFASGGEGSGDVLIPLLPNEQYLIRLENEGGAAKVAGLCCIIIEE